MERKSLTDRIALFVCCAVIYLCTPRFNQGVVPLLAAVCLAALLDYCGRTAALIALSVIFIAAGIFVPPLAVFLPVLVYESADTSRAFIIIPTLLPLAFFTYAYGSASIAVLTTATLAVILKYSADSFLALRQSRSDLEDENRQLTLEMGHEHRLLLENQDAEISVAKLAERGRIAREIHDSVGHQLSSSILQVGALKALNKDETLANGLAVLQDTLNEAMDSIRSSVHDLRDDSIDLEAAYTALVKNFRFCPLDYTFDLSADPPPRTRDALIAIAKEGLTNIARHSNATNASLSLREHPSFLQLVISDNGANISYNEDNGIGLKNIRERVESFGGVLTISADKGFRVFITIPKGGINS